MSFNITPELDNVFVVLLNTNTALKASVYTECITTQRQNFRNGLLI
jgi:hypothetical protein